MSLGRVVPRGMSFIKYEEGTGGRGSELDELGRGWTLRKISKSGIKVSAKY